MAEELQFHSMDEARAYIKMELESQIAHGQRRTEAWRLAKRATWLLLLAVAYLQYYLFDIEVRTLTLPTVNVSVPVSNNPPQKRT